MRQWDGVLWCVRAFFDRLLGAFKARREALCRVVGWEVSSQDVNSFLLSRMDRLHRTFMNSGFTPDTIIEAVFRHGLLQVSQRAVPFHHRVLEREGVGHRMPVSRIAF